MSEYISLQSVHFQLLTCDETICECFYQEELSWHSQKGDAYFIFELETLKRWLAPLKLLKNGMQYQNMNELICHKMLLPKEMCKWIYQHRSQE